MNAEATQQQAGQLVNEIERLKWHGDEFASYESETVFGRQLLILMTAAVNEDTPPSWIITTATQMPLVRQASVRQIDIQRRNDWSTGAGLPVYATTLREAGTYEGGLRAVKERVIDGSRDWRLLGFERSLSQRSANGLLQRLAKLYVHDMVTYPY